MTDVAISKSEGDADPKLLVELKTNECRYPVSERAGQHLFCGKRRYDATTAYCGKHLRLMYAEKKPKPIVVPVQR